MIAIDRARFMLRTAVLASAATLAVASIHARALADGSDPRLHGRLTATLHVDHLDLSSREPALLQHHTGALFVAGDGRDDDGELQVAPRLWRSDDGGASWHRVDVGSAEQGAVGNSDT